MSKRILWTSISTIAVLLLTLVLVQPVFADADNVTLTVLDSYGNPLDGVDVYYNDYSNHWVLLGTTTGGNPVTATFADGTYNIKAVKDDSQQIESVIVSSTGSQTFQTDKFTVHVKDANEATLEGIAVAYNDYSNHYLSMGNTDSDGNASIELFPGTYTFQATKDYSTVTGTTSNTIEFQTSLFTVHVRDSSGADFEGIAVAYNDYSNHYLSMGTTDSIGNASIELFSGTYTFRATKDYSATTGSTSSNIEFQTALFMVHVVNSGGANYQGIAIGYNDYSNHYLSMGTTDSDGNASIELFPGTYTFKATEDHTEDIGILSNNTPGTNAIIEFPTAKAIGIVKDCDGTPLAGFKVAFNDYSNHWTNMGTTGVDGMASIQLFPGARTIRAWIDYTYEVEDLDLIWPESTVEFNPTKVNFTYSGSVQYNDYSNHWKTMTSPFYLFPGTYTFMFDDDQQEIAIDGCEMSLPYGDTNQDPVLNVDQSSVSVDEGQTATNSGTVSDADADTVTLSASVGIVTNNGNDTWAWSFDSSDGPAESQMVTISADDGNGGTAEISFQLVVDNVAPSVDSITVPIVPVDTNNQPINVSATFSDPAGTDDEPYACMVDYGDGAGAQTGTVSGTTCIGPNQTYAMPGVYPVTVRVTDKDGGTGSSTTTEFIVIYDPSGGFVTGGGWIDSPAGAYKLDENLSGKASFGFVAKYKKGANVPDGSTEFQFKAGDLNFHSGSYDWLVVAGDKAQFKGEGTINGQGSYKFMISADDDRPDTFRIQIWGDTGIVYDNSSQQSLGGGSIVVH